MQPFAIDPDIRLARSLPSEVYHSPQWFDHMRDQVFRSAWTLAPPCSDVVNTIQPFTHLPGLLDEPLLRVRSQTSTLRVLSNVCTHRGNLLVPVPCTQQTLRCSYHGRRFGLDGRMSHMPEFEGALEFPSEADHLPSIAFDRLGPLDFISLAPRRGLRGQLQPLLDRTSFLPWDRAVYDPASSRSYEFDAHWALYCDNYLEGFHLPFVHPGLSDVLDYASYSTELFEGSVLQIGSTGRSAVAFTLPPEHPDLGRHIAAYYFWLYPSTMVNVYPWGLSTNAVHPLTPNRTRVEFATWIWDPALRDRGAGADLHTVELEDEAIVTAVQRGVRSSLFRRGRYSPSRETGVHHFHRLLAAELCGAGPTG